jgi:hypothetical protein
MPADLCISLYEIFGHLIPGTVTLIAAVTGFWALFSANAPLPIAWLVAVPWYVALILAYLAGILTQALASQIEDWLIARSNRSSASSSNGRAPS